MVIAKSLEEAIQRLRSDPLHPVEAIIDDLRVELRVPPPRSAADVFREIGPWEGESTDELWKRLERAAPSRAHDEQDVEPGSVRSILLEPDVGLAG